MFEGFGERLDKELKALFPGLAVKVVASPERKYSTWLGGSILASLSTFSTMWITSEGTSWTQPLPFFGNVFGFAQTRRLNMFRKAQFRKSLSEHICLLPTLLTNGTDIGAFIVSCLSADFASNGPSIVHSKCAY
jgi:hypothetical protein